MVCHGSADEVVDYSNAENLMAEMTPQGADISLKTYGSETCSTHTDCAQYCLRDTASQLWEYEGKWTGALRNNQGIATAAIVVAVVGVVLLIVGGAVAQRKCRSDNYEMIA